MNSKPNKRYLKDQIVKIRPEFQDEGDDECIWTVLHDEEKGRVDIVNINSLLKIKPIHTVKVEWLEPK
jgi:hypothetical protein